ncbi:MAG: DNA-directed RNA polymerase subunit alpha C-terminal domain-containing protein [Candidatus Burarchaeum sp.]|nr:DNA-directed RNA polymerase subunit alpha C-terminal domain-containing protein [Candidatus Burarchaeum sp.]MDO8340262.1 DNA-directed RNA polymerase subunit alpha C-terminal domain-containing protein [Candidatus Burarchaeum sp.]
MTDCAMKKYNGSERRVHPNLRRMIDDPLLDDYARGCLVEIVRRLAPVQLRSWEDRLRIENAPIEELKLSARPYNCLKKIGVRTVGELLRIPSSDLLKIRNFGILSLKEVSKKLRPHDLALDEKRISDRPPIQDAQ